MTNMNSSHLKHALIFCVKKHHDEMSLLYGCLDRKRAELDLYNSFLKEKERAEEDIKDLFVLVMDTYVTFGIAFIGIFVNIMGCCQLLNSSERKKMFSLMLVSILSFDLLYLACKLIRSLEYFIPVPYEDLWLYYTIADTIGRFSLTGSILMMVAIGRVRYNAIRTPLHQRILSSSSKKRIQLLLKYLIPTTIVSLTSTSPLILEIYGPPELRLSPLYCFFVLGIWNFVLLGMFPCVSLMYFAYKIIVLTNKRRQEHRRQSSCVVRNINESSEKITRSLVGIIVVFVVLQFPRIVGSVGEYYVLTIPNRNETALELGFGIPMWLRILGPIHELCTALNACLNIIIYRYLNSPRLPCWFLNCGLRSFQRTTTAETLLVLPMANIHHANTQVEEQDPSHAPDNVLNIDDVDSLSIAGLHHGYIPKENDASRNSSHYNINIDDASETITFQVRRKGLDYL